MKAINYLKVALLVVPFLVAGCKTKKAVVEPTKPLSTETLKERDFLLQVNDNAQYAKFVTSKVKFSVRTIFLITPGSPPLPSGMSVFNMRGTSFSVAVKKGSSSEQAVKVAAMQHSRPVAR